MNTLTLGALIFVYALLRRLGLAIVPVQPADFS
jgi:hypothetical protein